MAAFLEADPAADQGGRAGRDPGVRAPGPRRGGALPGAGAWPGGLDAAKSLKGLAIARSSRSGRSGEPGGSERSGSNVSPSSRAAGQQFCSFPGAPCGRSSRPRWIGSRPAAWDGSGPSVLVGAAPGHWLGRIHRLESCSIRFFSGTTCLRMRAAVLLRALPGSRTTRSLMVSFTSPHGLPNRRLDAGGTGMAARRSGP